MIVMSSMVFLIASCFLFETVVLDGAVSNENIHIISEKAALSLWHQANFKVDKFKYTSIGQYVAHQKACEYKAIRNSS